MLDEGKDLPDDRKDVSDSPERLRRVMRRAAYFDELIQTGAIKNDRFMRSNEFQKFGDRIRSRLREVMEREQDF